MNRDWYYRVNLSLYLMAVIWVIGCLAPVAITGYFRNPIGWWTTPVSGYPGGYPGDFIMLCYYWVRSTEFVIVNSSLVGYLALALVVGFLVGKPPANPLKVLGFLFRDPSYKADRSRMRFGGGKLSQNFPMSSKTSKAERRGKLWQSQRTLIQKFLTLSLRMAMKQQGLGEMYKRLEEIVPDVSRQYNTDDLDNIYWTTKIRAEQAFHASLMLKVMEDFDVHSVMDIGDSAGTHIIYLRTLSGKALRAKSLSIDRKAIEHIKRMNLEVVEADAEKYDWSKENYDMLMVFDTLEHLCYPSEFLYRLSKESHCKVLVISVPYLEKGRIRLDNIKLEQEGEIAKGSAHIYEMNPKNWKSIFKNSGWAINYDQVFYQYPRHIPIISRLLRRFWRRNDFEGFYGAVLTPGSDYRGVCTVVRGRGEQ